MARNAAAGCFVALTAFGLSGCGTLYNSATNAEQPYGGVIVDAGFAGQVVNNACKDKEPLGLLCAAFPLADMPLSFVADTLMLPYPECH